MLELSGVHFLFGDYMSKTETIDASGKLFDAIIWDRGLKNDAALARELGVKPPQISKIRHGKLPVTSDMILIVHDKIGYPIKKIRDLIAS
jgi:plasmid maintenance system antidote protein VapI